MKITDQIAQFFRGGKRLFNSGQVSAFGGWNTAIGNAPFADAVFLNCVELLTDLTHDVTWRFDGSKPGVEVAFVRFFNSYGKMVLNKLYRDGVVVIKHTQEGEGEMAAHSFDIAVPSEYSVHTYEYWTTVTSNRPEEFDVYAIKSAAYQTTGKSDRQIVAPFLDYLDSTLNASNTVNQRMGAMVVCSPKNLNSSPMATILDEEEQKELGKILSREYGALNEQSQVLVMPREMSWQVISLAQLDLKTTDKVKNAVLAIADRIKVPANQVAMIDANSSKSLANGTELREGDINKYQSFERLLDQTFVQLARDCGLRPGMVEMVQGMQTAGYYTIYNKPSLKQEPAQNTTNE